MRFIDIAMEFLSNIHYSLFLALLTLNLVDIITGRMVAKRNKKLNSHDGMFGILKKALIWFIIYLGFLLPVILNELGSIIKIDFNISNITGYLILGSVIFNEYNSIIQNLINLDVGIPKLMSKGLKIFNDKLNGKQNDEL